MKYLDQLADWWFYVTEAAKKLWLIVRHRPFFACPFCAGKGGEVSGYYEPEWRECPECWHRWKDLEDHGVEWTTGRMPLLEYLRAKVSLRCGLWYTARFRDIIRCRLGWHKWNIIDQMEPGLQLCSTCYEHRHVTTTAK